MPRVFRATSDWRANQLMLASGEEIGALGDRRGAMTFHAVGHVTKTNPREVHVSHSSDRC